MGEPNFKPRICTWEDLSYTDAICLLQSETTTEVITDLLTATLNQTVNGGGVQDKRAQITQDLFYYMVLFARKNNFQPDQLSTLFTILKTLHLFCISSPYDNMESCFQLLQDLLLCHSIHRPPYSTLLYDLNQIKLITDYILQTYFKHFKLYKYAFTKRVLLDIHIKYEGIEDTPIPSQTCLEETVKESDEKEDEDTHEGEHEMIDDEKEKEMEDIEEDSLTEEQRQLKELISQSLNDHLKQLKMSVENELSMSDKRLSERLSVLEDELDTGSKGKKKSK